MYGNSCNYNVAFYKLSLLALPGECLVTRPHEGQLSRLESTMTYILNYVLETLSPRWPLQLR